MSEPGLRRFKGGRPLIVLVAVAGAVLIVGRVAVDLYVELRWYESTGYGSVFLRRLSWFWGTRLLAGGVVATSLLLSLRLVARTLGGIQIKRRFGNIQISEQLPSSYVWWTILAVSVLLGAWFGGSVPERIAWAVLAALQGVEWGVVEPVLGRDVSFYVFALPLLRSGSTFLMVLVFLVFSVVLAGYAATGALRWGRGGVVMGDQPRIHLGVLVVAFVLLIGVRLWISRSVLLLSGNSAVQGIFGYADAEARLPALAAMIALTVLAGAAILWGVWQNRLVPLVAGLASLVVGSVLALQFYPSLVQRFRVEPNELERESPWIEHNLRFTRLGFGLETMERRSFGYRPSDSLDWRAVQEQLDGLPVWTEQALVTTYQALEARYPYYRFSTVDIDRYPVADGTRAVPVAISVREVDPDGIQEPNWQNLHLRETYIAGVGAVAAAASRRTPEGRPPMYLAAIPPEFRDGPDAPQDLRLTRPQVYFGSRPQFYAVVSTGGARGGTGGSVTEDVDAPRGILLDRFLRKLALAWYLKDANLLFASEVTDSSRVVFRRQVSERAEAIAPFFRYPEAPYPVIAEGRVVWILEGFTASRHFPLSTPHELPFRASASYLRSSVKVTVDAVTGETSFWALSEHDPLRDAYGRAFPGLLRPVEEMPEALRRHLRYPKTLLSLQATVLLQYHQETAARFHGQQDVWATPHELFRSTSSEPYRPEYGIYRIPGEEAPTFNLTTVFVPAGRPNLTAVLTGRLGDDGRLRLELYDVPVEDQAPGPRQVEALVEQDPEISQQFSLWRTGGSQVWTGHLHLVPVGSQLIYMEPVFLAAESDAIPELRRFVVSDGSRVSMEPTLDEALASLSGDGDLVRRDVAAADAPADAEPGVPGPAGAAWPAEALDLLERAEARLRAGDWAGFGRSIEELRALLSRLAEGGRERR